MLAHMQILHMWYIVIARYAKYFAESMLPNTVCHIWVFQASTGEGRGEKKESEEPQVTSNLFPVSDIEPVWFENSM